MLDINTIKELWIRNVGDVASEIASWDSVASEYLLEDKNTLSAKYLILWSVHLQVSKIWKMLDILSSYVCLYIDSSK